MSSFAMEPVVAFVEPGIYRHFKGREYELLEVARHSESNELLVVYRPLDGSRETWVRPLAMFLDVVQVGDEDVPRFERVRPRQRRSAKLAMLRRIRGFGPTLDRLLARARTVRPHASLMRQREGIRPSD